VTDGEAVNDPRCDCWLPLECGVVTVRSWQPARDRPPKPTDKPVVQSVSIIGMNPSIMRTVYTWSGWLRHGNRDINPVFISWNAAGLCPLGMSHPVVDASEWKVHGQCYLNPRVWGRMARLPGRRRGAVWD
jgi:hypothetical protein